MSKISESEIIHNRLISMGANVDIFCQFVTEYQNENCENKK
jgi:hypothetical protein